MLISGGKCFRIFCDILGVKLNLNAPMANVFRTKVAGFFPRELQKLSLQIRTLHRREFCGWRSSDLDALLNLSGQWKTIPGFHTGVVLRLEFPNVLEQILVDGVTATALFLPPENTDTDCFYSGQSPHVLKRCKSTPTLGSSFLAGLWWEERSSKRK